MVKFIHLHCHSEYSVVDGLLTVNDIINFCVNNQQPAIALTDLSNLFAMVKFYKQAIKSGIKPIIGCEVIINTKNKSKLILLCKNHVGYKNLVQIISNSFLHGQKDGYPVIDLEWIKKYRIGLIAITPGIHSDLAKSIQANDSQLEQIFNYWSDLFNQDFYVGISRTNRENENELIAEMVNIAKRRQVQLVALNDVRFKTKDEFEAHEARICINQSKYLNDRSRSIEYSEEQYLKTSEQMQELFVDIPVAVENTVTIAKKCNLSIELNKVHLPKFPVPNNTSAEQYLHDQAIAGLEKLQLNLNDKQQYLKRLSIELEVISSMGFAGYFLIVADFIAWAHDNQVPVGPGRGSGAGSLVAYCLKITNIDPIKYDLLFERFLNPERVSMPDFDIDFCMEGRDRVIEYVANKYGRDSVSQIITYGTLAARAVIRDVGRVLGYSYGFVDKIAKLVPVEIGITLDKTLERGEGLAERYKQEDEVKLLIDLARRLEGKVRNVGTHAGGVVIAPKRLTAYSPIYCESGSTQLVTQFDKDDIETIGLIKFDFLGLRTLTIIKWAVDIINSTREHKLDLNNISLEDDKTFELLRKCKTTAVFQLESRGMKDLIRRLRPDRFEDIVALVALFRPGPLQSGMVDDFINCKLGKAEIEYLHPSLTEVLKPTYGIILYQEQVMQIAQILSGYTLGAADMLRRAMGKKKPEEMAKQRDIFIKGAIANNIDKELATYIFDLMEKFAGYGFNKSHSAAYAIISYQTAWLKANYPCEFMAAVLSADMGNTDKIMTLLDDCRSMGITIKPPCINTSQYKFTVSKDKSIVYGLGAVKGVGNSIIDEIVKSRHQQGKFTSIIELCKRPGLAKLPRKTFEILIMAGAFDSINPNRAQLYASIDIVIQAAKQHHKDSAHGQSDMFADSEPVLEEYNQVNPWTEREVLQGEKTSLGLYLSGHPLNQYREELAKFVDGSINELANYKNSKRLLAGLIVAIKYLRTKRGDRMAVVTIEDHTARVDVTVFSDLLQQNQDLINQDQVVLICGEIQEDSFTGGIKIRAISITDFNQARADKVKYLRLVVEGKEFTKLLPQMKQLFIDFKGKCPIQLEYPGSRHTAIVMFGKSWCINPQQELIDAILNLCPDIKAKFIYEI